MARGICREQTMDPREKTPSRDTVNHVGGNKPASASVEAGFSFSSPPPSSQPPGDLIYFRDRERRRGFKGSLEMREQFDLSREIL